MNRFILLPELVRLGLLAFSVLAVALQAAGVTMNFFRFQKNRATRLELGTEVVLLLHHLILSLLLSTVISNQAEGILIPINYVTGRYVAFLILAVAVLLRRLLPLASSTAYAVAGHSSFGRVVAAVLRLLMCQPSPLLLLPAAALTLPVVETLSGPAFPLIYGLAVLFWLLRAGSVVLRRSHEMQGSLSGFSIKQAMDALHSGLLYCESSGRIRLMNRQMQRLMVALTGEVLRSGMVFRSRLRSGQVDESVQTATLEGSPVYRLADGTVWLFGEDESRLFGKTYTRLFAAEVTGQWNLTTALEQQEALLTARQEELRSALTNLEEICRSEERLRVKSKVHDVMAQRLAMLMQLLRAGRLPENLSDYAGDLLGDVRAETEEQSSLETLQIQFAAIGVTVVLEGDLPADGQHSALFADLAREGITNAVRHSLASEVRICWSESAESYTMTVSNSGFSTRSVIREGGGITELHRKLAQVGGSLQVTTRPAFVLAATIPKEVRQ